MADSNLGGETPEFNLPFLDPLGEWDQIIWGPSGLTYRRGGERNRTDGPASIGYDGSYAWLLAGREHRIGGPASLVRRERISAERYRHVPPKRSGGYSPIGRRQWCESWYQQGFLHRLDGPALRWQDGSQEWFVADQRHRERLPAVVGSDGLREWHFSHTSVALEDAEFDLSYYRMMFNAENFYRERGPSVILGDGTRFWGGSREYKHTVVGVEDTRWPKSGPWIEYSDGSIDFVENGPVTNRSAGHPSTVALRREARHYVEALFLQHPFAWLHGKTFLPWVGGVDDFGEKWLDARLSDRRSFASWALIEWEAVQGNLSHEDERQSKSWVERFEQTMSAEVEEIRLGRENMKGYLRVALLRLDESNQVWPIAELQSALEYAGLPLSGAIAALTSESRLLRAVVTAPSITQAVPAEIVPLQSAVPAKKLLRTPKVRNELYVNGIAELALAALSALVRSEDSGKADTVLLNVMVDDVDTATGLDVRYCVLSVQVEREDFKRFDLGRVDPLDCVRRLGAVVPRGSTELSPVRPIIEFDKDDARLISATEVAAHLDSRANLMELSPTEFESLIQNLFTKIGLDTHQTQASRDGGVDAIAYDSRPIFGGKIIIQAKRYKNTVGVSAVRDLYGTVLNEGAGKGLLVTTSGYGKSSYEFAKNKPLELLEGGHLLHLLKEHLGLDAVIIPPATWVDPAPDIQESDQPAGA